jgi:hypothetical protein
MAVGYKTGGARRKTMRKGKGRKTMRGGTNMPMANKPPMGGRRKTVRKGKGRK